MPRIKGIDTSGEIVGKICDFGNSVLPFGFLACDGAAVSRTTYAALFAAVGTAFGVGDGSTTFNVPDKRGRAVLGQGQGAGLTNRTRGQSVGAETHQLSEAELASHTHIQNSHSHSITIPLSSSANNNNTNPAAGDGSVGAGNALIPTSTGGQTATNQNTGGNSAHNNMQPSLVCNHGIAYV